MLRGTLIFPMLARLACFQAARKNGGKIVSRSHEPAGCPMKLWRESLWFPALAVPLTLLGVFWILCLIHVVFGATVNPRHTGWVDVETPDGTTHRLELWRRDPLVSLPFSSNSHAYVRYAGREMEVSNRGFGWGVGGVVVSPDGRRAVAEAKFEGAPAAGVLIDLQTGDMTDWDRYAGDMSKRGWKRLPWQIVEGENFP
jgi:hypothetical protein